MTSLIKQKTGVLIMSKFTNYILLIFIFITALFYVYFANTTIRTVTLLEKTKKEMRTLSVVVSEMESQRLSAENNISIAKAEQMGFTAVNHPVFIMKSSQKASLSLKTD